MEARDVEWFSAELLGMPGARRVLWLGDAPTPVLRSLFARGVHHVATGPMLAVDWARLSRQWDRGLHDALLAWGRDPADVASGARLVRPGGLVLAARLQLWQGAGQGQRLRGLDEAVGQLRLAGLCGIHASHGPGGTRVAASRASATQCLLATGLSHEWAREEGSSHDAGPDGVVRVVRVHLPGGPVEGRGATPDVAAERALVLLALRGAFP